MSSWIKTCCLLGLMVMGGVLRAGPATAACTGQSKLTCIYNDTLVTAQPTGSQTCSVGYYYASASFDIRTMAVSAAADQPWETHGEGMARTDDDFWLVGQSATPISFQAQLALVGFAMPYTGCCEGSVGAVLQEGTSNQASWGVDGGPGDFSTAISVSLVKSPGETFHMQYQVLAANAEGGLARITGTLQFLGLPAGVSVASCRQTTKVHLASWGTLRRMYH